MSAMREGREERMASINFSGRYGSASSTTHTPSGTRSVSARAAMSFPTTTLHSWCSSKWCVVASAWRQQSACTARRRVSGAASSGVALAMACTSLCTSRAKGSESYESILSVMDGRCWRGRSQESDRGRRGGEDSGAVAGGGSCMWLRGTTSPFKTSCVIHEAESTTVGSSSLKGCSVPRSRYACGSSLYSMTCTGRPLARRRFANKRAWSQKRSLLPQPM
mmetsp:Transcript_798/g.1853  ORF Transcript_798/g.1853 Transcript_798/m.1853 type:complete len:221 (-) Transcript_798:730-1392(-)